MFFADGLHVYARDPELQIGPLAFAVARPLLWLPTPWPRVLAEVLMAAGGPLVLALLAPFVAGPRRRLRILLTAGVLMPPWTVLAVRWAHVDDVLALVFTVVAVRAVARHRPVVAGLALAAAVAAKPWAVGFTPIVLALDTGALLAAAVAVAGVAFAWLPFVLGDSGTLEALRPKVQVVDSSGLRLFGYHGAVVPGWGRTAQLVLAPAVALAAVLRRRWPGAVLAAVAVRLLLDPQDIGYYVAGAVVAAVIFDLLATRSTVPWATVVTAVALWQPFVTDYTRRFVLAHGPGLWWFRHETAIGWLHAAWAVAAVVVVLVWRPRRHAAG
jgi:hypothetical protein